MRINEHIVLITGGARGLGECLTRAFVREGARVVINYRQSEERAHQLVSELGEDHVIGLQADVTDAEQVTDMVAKASEHFGAPVTVAVNNALVDFSFNGDDRPALDTITWEHFNQQLNGAVGGALNVIRAVTPGMAEAGMGRIINIGTNLFQNPVVPYHDYTAAKAALLSLTRTAAKELGPQGITVNMISGGLLRTTDASSATPDAVFDLIAASTPLGRATAPEEFADSALFFASDWSRSVTGQNLVIDGGLVMD